MTPASSGKASTARKVPLDTGAAEIGSALTADETHPRHEEFSPGQAEIGNVSPGAVNETRFRDHRSRPSRRRPTRAGLMSRDRWQWWVLTVVLLGATMSALDVTIVNIALPTIKDEFHTSLALVEWISMAYMIVLALALPIVGRLADVFGRSRLYNIGFGVFIVGSALCGFAPGIVTLILARSLQAIGAALLQANSVALITQVFRSRSLGRALGAQAAVQGTAMALGPFVGAMLITFAGWRFIFFVNVPIGIAGTIAAHYILPRYHRVHKGVTVDYIGSALMTIGLMALVLAVNKAGAVGWTSPLIVSHFLLGLLCLAAFVVTELIVKHPTIDLRLFGRYTIAAGNITGLLAYYALFSVLFLLPFYFEQVLHYSAARTGIMLTAVPLAMALMAPFAGRACDRLGSVKFLVTGSLLLAAGAALLIFAPSVSHPLELVIDMVILGAGLGVFTPANNRATMAATPRDKLGMTGGFLNMMRSLGVILGVDISGMLFMAVASAHAGNRETLRKSGDAIAFSSKPAFMEGFHVVMASLVGISLACAVFSALRKETPRSKSCDVAAATAGIE
ncbi:MAG: MFS transporter [Betaproteobacteria bacterium]|nr:MFS transporter [Betaproteobacteria bacterium]